MSGFDNDENRYFSSSFSADGEDERFVSTSKIEKDTIVVGRVYYNNKSLIQLKKEKKKGKIEITDIDYTLNY